MALDDDIRILSAVSLFQGFTQEQLRLLAFGAETTLLQANHKLYREDEPILFSLRFRGRGKSALLDVDRYFGQFLEYIEKYPRCAPFDV